VIASRGHQPAGQSTPYSSNSRFRNMIFGNIDYSQNKSQKRRSRFAQYDPSSCARVRHQPENTFKAREVTQGVMRRSELTGFFKALQLRNEKEFEGQWRCGTMRCRLRAVTVTLRTKTTGEFSWSAGLAGYVPRSVLSASV
jgi:hypothetical protein